ncbi:MAG: DUF4340 domain-containing protein, partial [Bacteroidetes bacterium]
MKRTLILLLLFLVLGGAALLFMQKKEKTAHSTLLGEDRHFEIKNPDDIQKIFIAQRTGIPPVTLERAGDHWVVNKKYRARESAVNNVLEVLTTVRMESIPSRAALDNIVKELSAQGIKVEVYGKNDTPLKVFYVGGVSPDERATYFIMEGSAQPYAVEIPSMEGSLRPRFELAGDEWRDRAVFREKPENIQSLSVEYPKQRSKSFVVERKGNAWDVRPFYDITPRINAPVLQNEVEAWLLGFDALIAENFVNDYEKKDSVANT